MDLKKLRTALCLTQTELAEMLNVSLTTVTNWETGKKSISATNLKKIREICNKYNLNYIDFVK